ncbi:MAG: hypothetical protein KJ638_02675 [Chloroflexi bacterium]|nr:hypothetical protein [Chloroflexota bacterium]
MKNYSPLQRIRMLNNIRTMRSIRTNTGPRRDLWPRLKEMEQLRRNEAQLLSRRRLHEQRQKCAAQGRTRR